MDGIIIIGPYIKAKVFVVDMSVGVLLCGYTCLVTTTKVLSYHHQGLQVLM